MKNKNLEVHLCNKFFFRSLGHTLDEKIYEYSEMVL